MRRCPRLHPTLALAVLFMMTAPSVRAQTDQEATPPAATPEDVVSIDAIITAIYDVISGPAGQARDWDRFRSLLAPGCRFIPIQQRPDGTHGHAVLTAEQFIQNAGGYFEQNGFHETEIARKTERYGNLVHAFSTYESRNTPEETEPFQRGINSFQLLYEQGRWWIATIAWQPEWPNLPIPATYLSDTR